VKKGLEFIFTKIGVALTLIVLIIFLILKICCLQRGEYEILILSVFIIYFSFVYLYLKKLKKYLELIKVISYLCILWIIFYVFHSLHKISVLIWVYTTILSAYFILKEKEAYLLSLVILIVLVNFYFNNEINTYDFFNMSSAIIVFSIFSFYIYKLLDKYQKEKNKKERLLEQLANTDALTGAYNRRKFFEDANKVKGINGLIMLDLDKFKKINDTYGHHMGDKVLKAFADEVRKNIRREDFFARIGGEEFVIIFKNLNEKDTIELANKIRKRIENLTINKIKFTVSIGATVYKENEDIYEALKRADKALYEAKKVRNKTVFIK
jgi:diguanylate cyclase (GGDEF)-like protein